MRDRKIRKRAAAWMLTIAMVMSSNSFAALAEEAAAAQETEVCTEASEPAIQEAQDVSAAAVKPVEEAEALEESAQGLSAEKPAAAGIPTTGDTEELADVETPVTDTEELSAVETPATDTEEPAAADTESPLEEEFILGDEMPTADAGNLEEVPVVDPVVPETADEAYYSMEMDYPYEILANTEMDIETTLFCEGDDGMQPVEDYTLEVSVSTVEGEEAATTIVANGKKLHVKTGAKEETVIFTVFVLIDGKKVASFGEKNYFFVQCYKAVTNNDRETKYNPAAGETLDWEKLGFKVLHGTLEGEKDVTASDEISFIIKDADGWKVLEEVGENGLPVLQRLGIEDSSFMVEIWENTPEGGSTLVLTKYIFLPSLGYDDDMLIPSYGDGRTVFSDRPLQFILNRDKLKGLDNYRVEWSVEREDYYGEGDFIPIEPDTGLWEKSDDGNMITVHAMVNHYNDFRVSVKVNHEYNGKTYTYMSDERYVYAENAYTDVYMDDTYLLNESFPYKDTVECYIYNADYPNGAEGEAEVVDVAFSEPGIMEKTTVEIGTETWHGLKAVGAGKVTVTFTLKNPQLLGSGTYQIEKTLEVLPYQYDLSSTAKDAVKMYAGDTYQIGCTLKFTGPKDGGVETSEVSADKYTLTYTPSNPSIISVSGDGLVTVISDASRGAYVRVAASIDGETVAETQVSISVLTPSRGIALPETGYTLAPGETVKLEPVVMDFDRDHRSGTPAPGDWSYTIESDYKELTLDPETLSITAANVTEEEYMWLDVIVIAVSADGERLEESVDIIIDSNKGQTDTHVHSYDKGRVTKLPTCMQTGERTYTCSECGEETTETIPALGHAMDAGTVTPATCGKAGEKTFKCKRTGCTYTTTEIIPALEHAWNTGTVTTAATCAKAGVKTFKCKNGCGETKTEAIPKLAAHSYGQGVKVSDATVFEKEKQKLTCSVCGATQTVEVGSTLKPVLKVPASSLKMKMKQSTTKFTVTEMAAGDSLLSVVPSSKKIVKVSGVKANGTFKLTAQKKKGSAKITITLKSGLKKTVTVKVQSAKVTTTKISGVPKKATLKVKKKLNLKPVLAPVTSQDKITYTSSNKKVATVSSKGVVTAKKAGTVKITVKSGKKKVTCTVKVTK